MKKTMIFLAVLLSVVLLTGSVSAKGAQSGTDEVQLVSPALSVLAEQTGMAMVRHRARAIRCSLPRMIFFVRQICPISHIS